MEQTKEAVKQISHGNDVYKLMVFPDRDRWLWFVTRTSTYFSESPEWGRLLGCGDAPGEKAAWKHAKSLVEGCRKRT